MDKPGAQAEGEEAYNAFRFNASRWDASSGTYDMGFRNYDPGLNRFLTRDTYGGALADMGLAVDPFTNNRYAFTGGNPISFVELDGHLFGMSWSDIGHAALDVAGMVPVIGEAADVANGIWYAAEGNYVDAALSMASAIPLAGNAVAAAKLAKTGKKIADGVDTAKDVKNGVEATTDASRTLPTTAPQAKTDIKVDAGPACTKANSFVPGTRVMMADGNTKAIEELQVGDEVYATDVESGDNRGRAVTNVRSHEGTKTLITFTVDLDGKDGSKTGSIVSTDAHLVWLPDSGMWVKAAQLKPGMWLQTAAGTWVQVTAVKRSIHHERVHNLTVDGVHTYDVLANDTPLLVHNCDGEVSYVRENANKSDEAADYEAGALGAQPGRAPALDYVNHKLEIAEVRFDGFDPVAGVLIDRKHGVATTRKSRNAAIRQSMALEQNGYTGRWEVPNERARKRAEKVFAKAGVTNIVAVVVKHARPNCSCAR